MKLGSAAFSIYSFLRRNPEVINKILGFIAKMGPSIPGSGLSLTGSGQVQLTELISPSDQVQLPKKLQSNQKSVTLDTKF